MKKTIYLLLFGMLFVAGCCEQVPQITKQTMLYAAKGADSLYLDRYTMPTEGNDARPCLIFVFGGGFIAGNRDAQQYLPFFDYMVGQGYDVVSIDYRLGLKEVIAQGNLSPEVLMTGMAGTVSMAVEDLYDATTFIADKADEWGIDSSQIVLCGSSAGAITVLQGEYGLCNASGLAVQHLPAEFRYAGVISFAGAIFSFTKDLAWQSQPAPMMLFHGDADGNVPYDVVREGDVGFFGSKYIAGQLNEMNTPYYFYSFEGASHVIATSPMDQERDAIDAFLSKLVVDKEALMINTNERTIGAPEVQKTFTLADYISSNFQ